MNKKEASDKAHKILTIIDFNAKYSDDLGDFRGRYLSSEAFSHIFDILMKDTVTIPSMKLRK